MAELIRLTGDDPGDRIALRPGVNRFGTNSECDFIVDHSSVSPYHCEIVVDRNGLTVRDLNSLNGTFVDESPVAESRVRAGQTIRLGELQLKVADDRLAATTRLDVDSLADRITYCSRHPDAKVTFRCTHCEALMCTHCVHVLKLHGGSGMFLCPRCSNRCEPIEPMDERTRKQMIEQLSMIRTLFAPRSGRQDSSESSD